MVVQEITKKVEEVLASRKNSNNIVEIYNLAKNKPNQRVLCIRELLRLFTALHERKEFEIDKSLKAVNTKEWENEEKYVKWLWEMYNNTVKLLLECLDVDNKDLCEIFECLMTVLSNEGEFMMPNKSKGILKFPDQRLQEILEIMLSSNSRKLRLIECFREYVKYDDILFYTWKILKRTVEQKKNENELFLYNVLELIRRLQVSKYFKKKKSDETEKVEVLCKVVDGEALLSRITELQKNMTKVWQNLTNRNLTPVMHRKLMVILLESFILYMENPIFLTDFFMASTSMNGANAILGMQGMLVLVQKCNIEYPNIYGKLYSMLEPKIFYTKYKSRLFYLADIFLSSSHLPESMVAAFAKRVARLSLTAQTPDIIISIQFIQNLILRHPGLKKMVQHPDGGEVKIDPYLPDELDPVKSNALDSCLWEVDLLKKHVHPTVSKSASFIDSKLPDMEFDLGEVLDTTYDELFESDAKKKCEAALSISRPVKVAMLEDDRVFKMWSLT